MRPLLSFFTALPVGDASLEAAAERAYLLPLIGVFTAVPGAALILASYIVPPGVAATLALGAVLLAAGLHHTDGVLDVGDALMARGPPQRRLTVLKDSRVGVGGLGALFVVYAPTLAALVALADDSPPRAALALMAGEISARSAMLLALAFGKPAEANSSSSVPFARSLKGPRRALGASLALLAPTLCLLPLKGLAPLAALLAPLTALVALRIARQTFRGISGDLVGAAGELARAALLVSLSTSV